MADLIDAENMKAFLVELSELSRKHGITIGGCGCCDSPYVGGEKNLKGRYTVDSRWGCLKWTPGSVDPDMPPESG